MTSYIMHQKALCVFMSAVMEHYKWIIIHCQCPNNRLQMNSQKALPVPIHHDLRCRNASQSVTNGSRWSPTNIITKAFPAWRDKSFLFESMNCNIQKYLDPSLCMQRFILLSDGMSIQSLSKKKKKNLIEAYV